LQRDREDCLAGCLDDYVTQPIRVNALTMALMLVVPRSVA